MLLNEPKQLPIDLAGNISLMLVPFSNVNLAFPAGQVQRVIAAPLIQPGQAFPLAIAHLAAPNATSGQPDVPILLIDLQMILGGDRTTQATYVMLFERGPITYGIPVMALPENQVYDGARLKPVQAKYVDDSLREFVSHRLTADTGLSIGQSADAGAVTPVSQQSTFVVDRDRLCQYVSQLV